MRAVVQRVSGASVTVNGEVVSRIGMGLCCLVGIEAEDGPDDIDYIARKIIGVRIFDDEKGVMNLDVSEKGGDIMLISQFTLLGDARKGRRPSYSDAEAPERARQKFEDFVGKVKQLFPGNVEVGIFQAMMDVSIINHGPVTILLDSKKLF
ncbi:MAG TPA: D-aminoacyl-tRNA deacylase [Desulfomonilia bacterium]|nr:D-aminoacyl-tRNA deacylase [Desulfomonilia bacterium]